MVFLFPSPARPLPQFQYLLVSGPYHVSAPVHLAVSYAQEHAQSRPIIFSPSRTGLKEALARLNDEWLATNSLCGSNIEAVSRVDMLYPPTPVHLSLVLSMLRLPRSNQDQTFVNPKTVKTTDPGLIILYEPSQYFPSTQDLASHCVSSYVSLISQTLASLKSLSTTGCLPRLVVFDSRIGDMKLQLAKDSPIEVLGQARPKNDDLEPLLRFVEPFFDTVAIVENEEDEDVVPSSQGEDISMEDSSNTGTSRRIEFFRVGEPTPFEVVHWQENTAQDASDSGIRTRTVFDVKD